MPCCGQKRAMAAGNGQSIDFKRASGTYPTAAIYEYVGQTGMTVTGPATGHTYRFAEPGAKVQIDARDVQSLRGLPNLRRVN